MTMNSLVIKRFSEYQMAEAIEYATKKGFIVASEKVGAKDCVDWLVFRNAKDCQMYADFYAKDRSWVRVYKEEPKKRMLVQFED